MAKFLKILKYIWNPAKYPLKKGILYNARIDFIDK